MVSVSGTKPASDGATAINAANRDGNLGPETSQVTIEPGAAFTVSAAQLSAVVGLSERRLRQLAAEEGMPRSARGRYPFAGAVQWVIEYWQKRAEPTPMMAARLRKTNADAERAELDLAARRKRLADIDTLRHVFLKSRARISRRLLAVAAATAPGAHRARTVAEVEALLRDGITAALVELST